MEKQKIINKEIGFGIIIEIREDNNTKIHNLKSFNKSIINLGVRFKE